MAAFEILGDGDLMPMMVAGMNADGLAGEVRRQAEPGEFVSDVVSEVRSLPLVQLEFLPDSNY